MRFVVGAVILAILIAGLVTLLVVSGIFKRTDDSITVEYPKIVNKPVRKYPDAPEESVKAQALSKVDFSNPHTVKNVPRMIPTMSLLEKLVIVRKLKEVGTPEAVQALHWIVENEGAEVEDRIQGHATGALVKIDSEEAWAALKNLANSEDPAIREALAVSLGYSKKPEADALLKDLEKDES